MIDTIYIEENLLTHDRVRSICDRFPAARAITCDRYSEIFNPKAQNFRLQKIQPSLILAEKFKNFVLPAPSGYAIGGRCNYYFSHMLNCFYDCRYCFLQGMYQSAHYVVFVNFEDFQHEIRKIAAENPVPPVYFFSGYDCDSLAMDPVTGFADSFLDFFKELPQAFLELRTKSTQIRSLLAREALPNCIVAFSFTPAEISSALEHKVPALELRIEALSRLGRKGWRLGLRFDPMIYEQDYPSHYRKLFERIFNVLDESSLHSVSFGSFRLPNSFFSRMKRLYPDEKLFASPLERDGNMISYAAPLRQEMFAFCETALLDYVPAYKLFACSA
ncbi:MAG: radical SAM protein [Methylococcales bacterium]